MFTQVIRFFQSLVSEEQDPVLHCVVYKDVGCLHVDGLLCDFPTCPILDRYCNPGRHNQVIPPPP